MEIVTIAHEVGPNYLGQIDLPLTDGLSIKKTFFYFL